jgi:hypothetical protein
MTPWSICALCDSVWALHCLQAAWEQWLSPQAVDGLRRPLVPDAVAGPRPATLHFTFMVRLEWCKLHWLSVPFPRRDGHPALYVL